MSPITHFLVSWAVAEATPGTTRRERVLIALGGIIPDVDGLGAVPDVVTRLAGGEPTRYFHAYHHHLHTAFWAAACTAGAFALASLGSGRESPWRRRALVAALVCLTFHLHLVCDLIGAKGPDGNQWSIPYWLSLAEALRPDPPGWSPPGWVWSGQWPLNDWKNMLLTGALLLGSGVLAVLRGYSFLEVLSRRLDAVVVTTLRRRFAPQRLGEAAAEAAAKSPADPPSADPPGE
ncbi:MAG: metal-dependent hydrolase [Planctomycetota bacterium]